MDVAHRNITPAMAHYVPTSTEPSNAKHIAYRNPWITSLSSVFLLLIHRTF